MFTDNQLLCNMTAAHRAMLAEMSELVSIQPRVQLENPSRSPDYVYFLESGMASELYLGRGDRVVEVAMFGSSGCTGCPTILGVSSSPQGITMQIGGSARRIKTTDFEDALRKNPELRLFLLRFVHTQMVQRDETALSASNGTIAQRLARWLLMVSDCIRSNDVPLTHEIIALMLSTRRAGVTFALGRMEQEGLVTLQRGLIHLVDRKDLEAEAGVYYGASKAEYQRLYSGDVKRMALA